MGLNRTFISFSPRSLVLFDGGRFDRQRRRCRRRSRATGFAACRGGRFAGHLHGVGSPVVWDKQNQASQISIFRSNLSAKQQFLITVFIGVNQLRAPVRVAEAVPCRAALRVSRYFPFRFSEARGNLSCLACVDCYRQRRSPDLNQCRQSPRSPTDPRRKLRRDLACLIE